MTESEAKELIVSILNLRIEQLWGTSVLDEREAALIREEVCRIEEAQGIMDAAWRPAR